MQAAATRFGNEVGLALTMQCVPLLWSDFRRIQEFPGALVLKTLEDDRHAGARPPGS
jgi:hypothetical protein